MVAYAINNKELKWNLKTSSAPIKLDSATNVTISNLSMSTTPKHGIHLIRVT